MKSSSLSFPHLGYYRSSRDQLLYLSSVDKMYGGYHCPVMNQLEDLVCFNQNNEYLKRFYRDDEFTHKITAISEYYQYHQELPRIFHKDIYPIIQNFYQDIRTLQYKFVKRKIKEDSQIHSRELPDQKTHRPIEKIIKNIELSYYNFEYKQPKKSKSKEKTNKSKNYGLSKNKKSMPQLPFYQYQLKNQKGLPPKKIARLPTPAIISKDIHPKNQPSKLKDLSKKPSANNSIDTPKGLSRAKSKASLTTINPGDRRRPSVSNLQNPDNKDNIKKKAKSTAGSLQRAESKRNINDLRILQQRKYNLAQDKKDIIKKQQGIKNMFRKAMETKKMIKISN